nr:tRNA pseudouridine(55) synthase TruB [Nakamurella deserti]
MLVDKPTGPTSHDIVGRGRRVLGTRRVGHAGTLDPLASGLLVLGVERGTKLLGHLALKDKSYLATIRLGQATTTDDAQGDVVSSTDATAVGDDALAAGIAALTGDLMQVPSSVSAIKVDGKRAYDLVRSGATVTLAARPVTVSRFDVLAIRRGAEVGTDTGGGPTGTRVVDVDVMVDCTTGTYIRALARDLGTALGVGAHLTALRRTRIGPFGVGGALDLWSMGADDRDTAHAAILPAPRAAELSFPIRRASADEARDLSYGRPLAAAGINGTYAVLDTAGELLALLAEDGERAKPVLVWHAAS